MYQSNKCLEGNPVLPKFCDVCSDLLVSDLLVVFLKWEKILSQIYSEDQKKVLTLNQSRNFQFST